jgi:hypothetical protein
MEAEEEVLDQEQKLSMKATTTSKRGGNLE